MKVACSGPILAAFVILSLLHHQVTAQEPGSQRRPILKSGKELITNSGLEEELNGRPTGWHLYQQPAGIGIHIGPYGIQDSNGILFTSSKRDSTEPGRASISQTVTEFEPGEKIEVTAWLQLTGFRGNCVVWARCDTDTGYVRREGAFENAFQAGYRLEGDTVWSPVTVHVTPDNQTAYIVIGVLVSGTGEVRVDEIHAVVKQTPENLPNTGPGLYLVEGRYLFTARGYPTNLKVHIPMPILWRNQVPLSFRAWTIPDGNINSVRIIRREHGFHVAELVFDNISAGNIVGFNWEAHVLTGPHTSQQIPEGIELPYKELPVGLDKWLVSTWCCDTEHPDIKAVAAKTRATGSTADVIIPAILKEMREVFQAAEGRVTQLTAVQALTGQGSCTSNANLGAALLRANGIPARILAGYPTWSGALQTHYVVEYWLPESGWRLMEPTMCLDDRPGFEQIEVSIVLPADESEENAGLRLGGAGGVPYLSLTEYPDITDWTTAPVFIQGVIPDASNCDHRAINLVIFDESPRNWEEAIDYLAQRWKLLMNDAITSSEAVERLIADVDLSTILSLEELVQILR